MHVYFLQTVHTFRGHWDFSFASAWNPDNQTFATGNQDRTCRVWDIRNLSKSVAVLHGNMAAIRCIRYTSDGKFMAMSESTDFLHIFDVASGYTRRQEVEFYGEVSGISFSPDSETLFLGANAGNNNLMEFRRQRDFSYLDSLM
jgi:WD40 repeat protein